MKRWTKRLIDFFLATVGLIILSPFLAIISLAILLTMGPPIFFWQVRAGYKGRAFSLIKFRTMLFGCDAQGQPLPDADRITKVGSFLRQYSLDELPQLWNIWLGEMSFVGPRPLLMEYLPRYSPEQARRHEVKPGLTGWAQVNGRNSLSWEERFQLDIWYADHWNLGLDAKIFWKTLQRVPQRKGVSLEGYATMPEFTGSKQKMR